MTRRNSTGWSRCTGPDKEYWIPFYDNCNPDPVFHPYSFRVVNDVWSLVSGHNYEFTGRIVRNEYEDTRFCELCGHTGIADQYEIVPKEECFTPGANATLLVGSHCVNWMEESELRAAEKVYKEQSRNESLNKLPAAERVNYHYGDREGFSPETMNNLFKLFRSLGIEFEPNAFRVLLNSTSDKVEILADLTTDEADSLPLTAQQRNRLMLWRENRPLCVTKVLNQRRERRQREAIAARFSENSARLAMQRAEQQRQFEASLVALPYLLQLAAVDREADIQGALSRYRRRGEFSPREMLFIANRLRKCGIRYRPVDFNVSLDQSQIRGLEDWQLRKLNKFLKPEQRAA